MKRNMDVATQLEELKVLQDGWLNGEGYAYTDYALDSLAAHYEQYYPAEDAPTPYIYPSPDKDVVRAEWRIGSRDISLDIDLMSGLLSYYHCLDLDTEQSEEADLDLATKSGWDLLAAKLR